jgi:hypothetical protein
MQIFHSDSPEGPFVSFSNMPHTPTDRMAIDGTLWVEDGTPYMVFCHEHVQVSSGPVEFVQLKPDLSATVGEITVMFNANTAPWRYTLQSSFVADGPFLYRTKTGVLLMIWSSFTGLSYNYAVGIVKSSNGKITGTWSHQSSLLYDNNGGHGSIFTTFDGKLCMVLHQPNTSPNERAHFYELNDTGDTLTLGAEIN